MIEFFQENLWLSALWLALFVWLLYSYIGDALSPIKQVNTLEATLLINKEDAVLLDIRPQKDFKLGHIAGARQLKAEEVSKADFKRLEKEKSKPIIVVCALGNTARKTASALSKEGFENVTVLQGGMNAWTQANLPLAK